MRRPGNGVTSLTYRAIVIRFKRTKQKKFTMHKLLRPLKLASTVVGRIAFLPILAFVAQSASAQLANSENFDIDRFSNFGEGWFETFYVEETQSLQAALDAGTLTKDTAVLITETAEGQLALVTDQMAFHHIAEGTVAGKDWMATF